MSEDDAAIVARWRAGDHGAVREAMRLYQPVLTGMAFKLLRSREDAREVVNDAFHNAHRRIDTFRGDSALLTWLVRITRNLAFNRYHYWRRRGAAVTCSLDYQPVSHAPGVTLADIVPADEMSTPHVLELAEFEHSIETALPMLEPRARRLIERRRRGETYEEISAGEGINLGTCKSSLARAREKLRKHIAA